MKIKKIIPHIIIGLLAFLILYFHPSSENMICDSRLQCNVEHKFLGFIKLNTNIKLSEQSRMVGRTSFKVSLKHYKETFGSFDRYNVYVVYPLIIDSSGRQRSPFIYYYTSSTSDNYMDSLNFEIDNFNSYISNPSLGYSMKSAAGTLLFIVIFVAAAIGFGAYYVFNFIEDLLKKIFRFIFKK
ncbi:MAG TPA: hypothetical protein IAD11_10170 [Candidatus Stercorousia faecigallinarum]|nr:hypothetical protein [Candidatus Stercorousia faecigallinarum]